MRKLALLLLLAPLAGFGQALLPIAPQSCVWRAGDDPDGALHWAAPDLDESSWRPYPLWKLDANQPRIWIRCHVDLSPLHAATRPALQLDMRAAYELFVDGGLAGAFGNMQTGDFTADFVRTFPLSRPIPAQGQSTIALRVLFRWSPTKSFLAGPEQNGGAWIAGDRGWLEDRHNSKAFVDGSQTLPTTIAFCIVGIAGVMMLGLYLSDRSRLAFLFFALVCWALSIRRILEQLLTSLYPISLLEYRLIDACVVAALTCYVLLAYALARKPVPWFYRGVIVLSLVLPVMQVTASIIPAAQSVRMIPALEVTITCVNSLFGVAFLSPFVAFWPWRKIEGTMRYVAAALMVWSMANEIFIVFLLSRNFSFRSVAQFVNTWYPVVQQTRATLMIAAIIVLLVLLFQDQRRTAAERAQLAGEMEAAREVQQQLVPASVPRIAGFHIDTAYLPAAEVGGDFYQVLPLADGATLIAVGDVSGKGLKAAMTGTLAIGALRALAAENRSPREIMTRLNEQMVAASQGGFITCLILRLQLDGTLTIANAGHIPPYLDGTELPVENSLPLGLSADATYAESTMHLAPRMQLTLITDGVPEATHPTTHELFGFERAAAISNESAENIAERAQHFGQEDDITVLTLIFSPAAELAEVLHA